jgi:glutamine synthetase
MSTPRAGNLTVDELKTLVGQGEIDTVIVAFADMQGRLVGKRVSSRLFLEEVLAHGAECCNYLLAVDVEMNTVDGYAMSAWDKGYGDMVMTPDISTLRRVPWLPGTAMVTADLGWDDGSPVVASPRQILAHQVERLAERGLVPYVGTELEFMVFDDSFREAFAKGYDGLRAASDYNIDYAMLASSRMEPLLREIRRGMEGAGMYCEGSKGECNLGQQEIAFRYDHALVTCDNHTIYKNGAKEIADQHGKSVTYMAKFDEREAQPHGMSTLFQHFVAGQLAHMRDLTMMFAPQVNSYKRFVDGSFAPTAIAWGMDNRTCAVRVVGHGLSMRMENRVPGGDVNPYLACAALIAAGLDGIDNELPLEDAQPGNAYVSGVDRLPTTLRDARDLFGESALARKAFGDEVVDHYLNHARIELQAFDAAVTDWERVRGFERF